MFEQYPQYPYLGYKNETLKTPLTLPKQKQDTNPGLEHLMNPLPIFEDTNYIPHNQLLDKTVIISGGDSGIGRSVSILFAKEGADIVLSYLDEHEDANQTKQMIEDLGRKCILVPGDLKHELTASKIAITAIDTFGKIDVLVNNCATQFVQNSILDITSEQLKTTFETNFFSYFYLTKAVLPYLEAHASIINTSSVTAFAGNQTLIDYSATKGAIHTFTKSMALSLADQKIRVNAVAPGPVWTPLIPASFNENQVETFGSQVPLKRPAQPFEVAYAYLYLASDTSRFVTGQTIHVNGGTMV